MATDHYKKTISSIEEYYKVSNVCAKYLYHRALRCKRKDESYMYWDIKLQNAIVLADRCLGIEWEKMLFGKEEDLLLSHGIRLDEMEDTTFRWDMEDNDEKEEDNDDGWTKVTKKPKKNNSSFINIGLIL
jgi:hypothetical protein